MRPRDAARRAIKAARLAVNGAFRRALMRGVAAAIEHRLVLKGLAPLTVVDIGANRGQFSVLSRVLFPDANIFAFEPQPEPAARFLAVFPDDPAVRLTRAAISARAGTAEMHVSRRHDNSSLLPISRTMTDIYPGTEEIGTLTVEAGPLPNYLSSTDIIAPALLKIDVQGGELDVLEGCGALLQRFDAIYVELSYVELYSGQALLPEVVRWLETRGFALNSVNNVARDDRGRPVQADCLFVRNAVHGPDLRARKASHRSESETRSFEAQRK